MSPFEKMFGRQSTGTVIPLNKDGKQWGMIEEYKFRQLGDFHDTLLWVRNSLREMEVDSIPNPMFMASCEDGEEKAREKVSEAFNKYWGE